MAKKTSYPGKTVGIVGFILAFISSLIGLIVSIVAFSISKNAGHKNPLALAGIIIGAASTLFGIMFAIYIVTMGDVATISLGDHIRDLCRADNQTMVTYAGTMYDCATQRPMPMP